MCTILPHRPAAYLLILLLLLAAGCKPAPGQPPGVTAQPVAETAAVPTTNTGPVSTANTGAVSTAEPAAAPYSIYQDELAPGWREWSWEITSDYQTPDPVYKGQQSLSITPARAWAGWGAWTEDGLDTTPYAYLTLAIRATRADAWYGIYLQDQSGEVLVSDGYWVNPPPDSWQEFQIPLSELGAAYTRVHGLRIMNNESTLGAYYLDEIGFGGTAPRPTVTPTSAPQTIRLSVDASQPVQPFSNKMLGVALVNWEHAWGKYFPADVPHLADVFKAADVGLIRYAGGLWANWVGWERLPQRTPYTEWQPTPANYAEPFGSKVNTGLTYSFHYGTDEIDNLALFAQQSGAEVLIQVNISNHDPSMWADMLHYANVEHDYGFKYWELGNEIDLETSQGKETGMDAATYQERARQYAEALRAVDPGIVIVGGVPAAAHDIVGSSWAEGTHAMSRYLEAAVAAGTDSLSYHWYQGCNAVGDPGALTVWDWQLEPGSDGIADPYENWRHMYSRIWSQIGPERVQNEVIPAGSSMPQGITELNFDACDHGVAPQNSNQINAVWMADVLGRLAYNSLDFVTWYTGYGNQGQGYPLAFSIEDYYPDTVYLRPSYYTLFLYGNYFGDQLVASASANEEAVSIWASTDSADPDRLKLIITNLSNSEIHSTVEIAGFSAASGLKYVIANPNPLDMSSGSNSQEHGTTLNGVALEAEGIASAVDQIPGVPVTLQGSSLVETFAPYTITAIVLEAGD